jgi:hypothetical protein
MKKVMRNSLSCFPNGEEGWAVIGQEADDEGTGPSGFVDLGNISNVLVAQYRVWRGKTNDFAWLNSPPVSDIVAEQLELEYV